MRTFILSASTLLILGLTSLAPAVAQSQRITCLKEGSFITCPGYGRFDYTSDNRYNRESEINNLFIQVLGRNATSNELRDFTQTINSRGWSLAQVRENLVNSQEFYQSVNSFYRESLGRNIDDNGLIRYRSVVINGQNLGNIRNEISNSIEARNRNNSGNYNQGNNSLQQRQFNDMYIQVLGRNANFNDVGGYNRSVNNNRNYSLAEARRDLVNSQQFKTAMDGLYQQYLGRNADTAGLQGYRNAVIAGSTFDNIRNEISNSPEAGRYQGNSSVQQRQFNDMYVQVLGRNANSNDVRSYNRSVNSNRNYSLIEARRDLVNSQQFRTAMNSLYQQYLGRDADTAGLQGYRNAVIAGSTFDNIKNEISNSPEAGRYQGNIDNSSDQSSGI